MQNDPARQGAQALDISSVAARWASASARSTGASCRSERSRNGRRRSGRWSPSCSADSEERYRGIVSQSLAGIVETNPTARFDIVNDWYCQMTGYSREELLHLWMQDITHAEDLPRNLQLIEKLAAEETPFEIENRYVRKDCWTVWVSQQRVRSS